MLFVVLCLEKVHQKGLRVVNMAASYENARSLTNLSLRQWHFISLKTQQCLRSSNNHPTFQLSERILLFVSMLGGGARAEDETGVENDLWHIEIC